MSTEPEIAVTHEPKKLGLVGKAIVGLMVVVTAGLVVGGGIAIRAKHLEDARRAATIAHVDVLALCVRHRIPPLGVEPCFAARYRSMEASPGSFASQYGLFSCATKASSRSVETDAWGNPIYYRCPGPIHKKGWDLISCGPNGVCEEGQGDDIVVGEDLPGGIAAISSESSNTGAVKAEPPR